MTRRFILIGLPLLLMILTGGVLSKVGRPPQSVPGPTPMPRLGPAPANCPVAPSARVVPSLELPAVGSFPVWVLGLDRGVPLHIGQSRETATPDGWPVKMDWLEPQSYTGLTMIQVIPYPHGRPLRFQLFSPAPQTVRETVVLNPRYPNLHPLKRDPNHPERLIYNQQWHGFTARLLVSHTDCYVMRARWPGGQWSIPFAVSW